MKYAVFAVPEQSALRKEVFLRMQAEGLVGAAMHSYARPNVQTWLDITAPHKGWLLACVRSEDAQHCVENVRSLALISPWQGRAWQFDFTVFRAHFSEAVHMAKHVISWTFVNAPCDSLVGLCAQSNRHAWRLAQQCSFSILGRIPQACYVARKKRYEDGVFVMTSKTVSGRGLENQEETQALCPAK